MKLRYREFKKRATLEVAALELLTDAFTAATPSPRVLMLTGGNTPFGVYAALAASGIRANVGVRVFLSDDRHVPITSGNSNYGRMRPMLDALHVRQAVVPDGALPPAVAAADYDRALAALLEDGVPFTLGILGLGADGHVAALFNTAEVENVAGHRALAVARPDGMAGVSVTPSILCAAERLVFWVAGPDKADAVKALRHAPHSIIAGLALDAAPCVELWYAPGLT